MREIDFEARIVKWLFDDMQIEWLDRNRDYWTRLSFVKQLEDIFDLKCFDCEEKIKEEHHDEERLANQGRPGPPHQSGDAAIQHSLDALFRQLVGGPDALFRQLPLQRHRRRGSLTQGVL